LVFVDFGMVGRLAPGARSGLRNLAIALGTRDVDRLMRAYGDLGVLLPGADLVRVRQVEAAVFERLWGKSVRELMQIDPQEMRRFAHEFRDLLYEMPFQMPSDLIFLGRCVAILSGMCTGLDPDFNLFSEVAPFARTMLTAEGGGLNVDSALTWVIEQVRVLAGLPGRLDGLLSRVERGELTVVARAAPELQRQLERMTTAINRLVVAVLLGALIVAVILLAVRR
jgi:predicted unusual protein kinase regulating ubiquinone biosynthesis (AarF/ABC1/UbiB family)